MPKPVIAVQQGIAGLAEDKTVINLKRTRDRVRGILDKYPETRNSRELLQLMYLLEYDGLDILLGEIANIGDDFDGTTRKGRRAIAIAKLKSWWVSGGKTNLRNLWNRANEVQNQEPQYAPSPEVRSLWDKQAKRDPFSF